MSGGNESGSSESKSGGFRDYNQRLTSRRTIVTTKKTLGLKDRSKTTTGAPAVSKKANAAVASPPLPTSSPRRAVSSPVSSSTGSSAATAATATANGNNHPLSPTGYYNLPSSTSKNKVVVNNGTKNTIVRNESIATTTSPVLCQERPAATTTTPQESSTTTAQSQYPSFQHLKPPASTVPSTSAVTTTTTTPRALSKPSSITTTQRSRTTATNTLPSYQTTTHNINGTNVPLRPSQRSVTTSAVPVTDQQEVLAAGVPSEEIFDQGRYLTLYEISERCARSTGYNPMTHQMMNSNGLIQKNTSSISKQLIEDIYLEPTTQPIGEQKQRHEQILQQQQRQTRRRKIPSHLIPFLVDEDTLEGSNDSSSSLSSTTLPNHLFGLWGNKTKRKHNEKSQDNNLEVKSSHFATATTAVSGSSSSSISSTTITCVECETSLCVNLNEEALRLCSTKETSHPHHTIVVCPMCQRIFVCQT